MIVYQSLSNKTLSKDIFHCATSPIWLCYKLNHFFFNLFVFLSLFMFVKIKKKTLK